MVTIKNEKIEMEEALKNKIEFICSFCNTTPIIYNGGIKMIEHTNLQYVEPHRIIIKGITFLVFNYENVVEPLVSKELWKQCQVQKRKNSRNYKQDKEYI